MTLPEPFQNCLILTGPTASGKTALALELAKRLDAEIIAMDSMTLYRGMDIGTAKPTPAERAEIPHHLIDVLDPWESGNVAWWLKEAARCCVEIESRGKQVLFVGGTPFYLKALLQGLFDSPPADQKLRKELEQEALIEGSAALHARLAKIDPVSAQRLHPNDLRRVVRALEVFQLTGKPLSEWQQQGWWKSGDHIAPGLPGMTQRQTNHNEFDHIAPGLPGMTQRQTTENNVDRISDESEQIIASTDPIRHPRQVGGYMEELPRCLAIDLPREELYARINNRVESMIAAGWIDEVKRLREIAQPLSKEAVQALGYREIAEYLDGKRGLSETIAEIQLRSRQFAKRQLTWFRGLAGCYRVEGKLTFDIWRGKMS